MLTDSSNNFADTWTFLDNRLEDLVFTSKIQSDIEQIVGVAAGSLVAAISSFVGAGRRGHSNTTYKQTSPKEDLEEASPQPEVQQNTQSQKE